MGCNPRNASRRGVHLGQLPNHLFAQAVALVLAAAVHGPEDVSVSDAGCGRPRILRHLHPSGHWNRPHSTVFPNQIYDASPAVALLDVAYRECRHFGPPQSTAQEDRKALLPSRTCERARNSGPVQPVQPSAKMAPHHYGELETVWYIARGKPVCDGERHQPMTESELPYVPEPQKTDSHCRCRLDRPRRQRLPSPNSRCTRAPATCNFRRSKN
jgi:hypothetical protein